MALPTSGPISFSDLNIDRGISSTAQVDIRSAALAYGLTAPDGMNEFYNVPTYDIYESCNAPSISYYYVPYNASNTFTSTIGGYCYVKLNTNVSFFIITEFYPNYPFTTEITHDGCSCAGGGGGEEPTEF
jgi:hypothetical protein